MSWLGLCGAGGKCVAIMMRCGVIVVELCGEFLVQRRMLD